MQITTKYHSDKNTGSGKIIARVSHGPEKGRRLTVGYSHEARDPHQVAAYALARKLGCGYVWYVGTVTLGNVYGVTKNIPEGLWSIESLAGSEREFIDATELQQIIETEDPAYIAFGDTGNYITYRHNGMAARIARRIDFEEDRRVAQ